MKNKINDRENYSGENCVSLIELFIFVCIGYGNYVEVYKFNNYFLLFSWNNVINSWLFFIFGLINV